MMFSGFEVIFHSRSFKTKNSDKFQAFPSHANHLFCTSYKFNLKQFENIIILLHLRLRYLQHFPFILIDMRQNLLFTYLVVLIPCELQRLRILIEISD